MHGALNELQAGEAPIFSPLQDQTASGTSIRLATHGGIMDGSLHDGARSLNSLKSQGGVFRLVGIPDVTGSRPAW